MVLGKVKVDRRILPQVTSASLLLVFDHVVYIIR